MMFFIEFAIASLLLMASVIALAYLISSLFNDNYLRSLVKIESSQIIISVLLLLFATSIFSLGYDIANSFGEVSLTTAINFVQKTLYSVTLPMYSRITITRILMQYATESRHYHGPSAWAITIAITGLGNKIVFKFFDLILFVYTVSIASLTIQLFLIMFAPLLGQMLFGIGVSLRVFPLTRKSGHLLMGLGLSSAIVFPFLYATLYTSIVDFNAHSNIDLFSLNTSSFNLTYYPVLWIISAFPLIFYLKLFYFDLLVDIAKTVFLSVFLPSIVSLITIASVSSVVSFFEELT